MVSKIQTVMRNCVKVMAHVHFAEIGVLPTVTTRKRTGTMRTFSLATGKGIVDETLLQDRGNHSTKRMMDDAILDGSATDDTGFGIEYAELPKPTRFVGTREQGTTQCTQIRVKIRFVSADVE